MTRDFPHVMKRPTIMLFLLLPLWLGSCAKLRKDKKPEPSPFGPTGIPPQLRAKSSVEAPPTVVAADAENVPEGAFQLTAEEDIIFTDPDNPDESLPELSTLLAENKQRGPWEESETIARKQSAREGKPLLIWFTDSSRSPMCKAISEELFSTAKFGAWAEEHLIRLRVDANIRGSELFKDPDLSLTAQGTLEVDVRNYVKVLKKRYKAMGHPTLILLNPSGEVVTRKTGYKRGQADFYFGLIKQGEVASSKTYELWRERLEKKGYREWEDRRGRTVLAKLTGYSKGTLTLIEPDGTRCRTSEKKLSKKDRKWIDEQKRLRGIE